MVDRVTQESVHVLSEHWLVDEGVYTSADSRLLFEPRRFIGGHTADVRLAK